MQTPLTFRSLRAGEGEKLVRCIERCYGDSHVDPTLYDARALDAQLESGARHAAVALTPSDEVAAHLGLAIRRTGDLTADTGLTLVDPAFRGQGLAHRLAMEVGRIAIELGLYGLHDYPVTVHGGTQRLGTDRAVGVGFLLDNMPADVEFHAMGDAVGRATPSLVRYIPLGKAPAREVFLPEDYAAQARDGYERCGLDRTVVTQPMGRPTQPDAPIDVEALTDERRRVAKIFVRRLSDSADELLKAVEDHASTDGPTQLDLPLDDPAVIAAVDALHSAGFFFGSLLPEFHDGDRLRLQRIPRAIGDDEIPQLESEPLQAVAEFVLRDARSFALRF